MRALLLASAIAAALLAPRIADACSLPYNEPFPVDATIQDTTPPGAVTVGVPEFHRYPENGTCGARGTLRLVLQAADEPSRQVGFQLRVVSGAAPAGLFPDAPVRAGFFDGDGLFFFYPYDAPRLQLEVEVRAVDAAGNLGPPTNVSLLEPEDVADTGGCATGGGAPAPLGVALLALTALGVTRRRSFSRRR